MEVARKSRELEKFGIVLLEHFVSAPGEAADAVREFAGDLAGVIGRSRVRDVDSVDNRGGAVEATSEVFALVAGNDAKRERFTR